MKSKTSLKLCKNSFRISVTWSDMIFQRSHLSPACKQGINMQYSILNTILVNSQSIVNILEKTWLSIKMNQLNQNLQNYQSARIHRHTKRSAGNNTLGNLGLFSLNWVCKVQIHSFFVQVAWYGVIVIVCIMVWCNGYCWCNGIV